MKLKLPLPLSVSIPIVLLVFGVLVGVISYQYERGLDDRNVERTVRNRAHYMGTHLSTMLAFYLETQAPTSAHREIAIAGTSPDLRIALVLDPADKVTFGTRFDYQNQPVAKTPAAHYVNLLARARETFSGITEITPDGRTLVGAFPFAYQSGPQTTQLRSTQLGVAYLEYDLEYPKTLARSQDTQRFRFSGAILVALCVVFLFVFHRILTGRVGRLAQTARSFAAGDLGARTSLKGADELSQVGRAFDEMAGSLQSRDAELRESEQRFRQLAENIAEVFWLRDAVSGQFLYVSPAFEKTFGRPVEDVLRDSKVWDDAIHPDDREIASAPLVLQAADGTPKDYRITRPDGTIRWVRNQSFPVRNSEGTQKRVAGIATDITRRKTARKEKEQLERRLQETQRLESLGVLAGGIAHDFNNLLTGVLGNASLARMQLPETNEAQKYIAEIEAVAVRAADLCKQMLAYSGKGRFEVQLLDLNALVTETTKLLQLSISKNASLQFALAPNLPAIRADPTQLRQVVMNLVINASEALEGKTGTIAVRCGVMKADPDYLQGAVLSPELPGGDYIFLEVSDTGSGMPPETLARIFDPFYTTKFTGRGLGLSAVLGIVRGHEGALKVYSEPGRGTSFKLLFPVAVGAAQPLVKTAPPSTAWRGSGTILLVDDERTVRLVTSRMLEAFGFSVIAATDGDEAVQAYRENRSKIVAVLMDLTMPKMDGEEAYRQLRAMDAGVKVILMSGFNEQEVVSHFGASGLAGFLQKPFTISMMEAKLHEVLG